MEMRQKLYRIISGRIFLTSLITGLVVQLMSCGAPVTKGPKPAASPPHEVEVDEEAETALASSPAVSVTVTLRILDAEADISEQLRQIDGAQSRVLGQMSPGDFELVYKSQTMPVLVGVVTPQGLGDLRKLADVQAIALNTLSPAALVESATIIRAHEVWRQFGLTGAGVTIALLDTGIDNDHPDLAGRIVAQHCFVACLGDDINNAQDDNGHGTHVAGIIASQGMVSPRGIAPGVSIVAVRVMDSTATDKVSDVVAGIDWVIANQTRFNVRIINLGMHRDSYEGICDAEFDPRLAEAVQRAQQAGIIVFAPAGNGGLAQMISAPACLSGTVSVGGTGKSDHLSWGSNSSPALDLLAPSELIVSTALGGGQTTYSGTSHASPHAAAVAALMLQANPGLSAVDISRILKETGVPIEDDRGNRSRITPRVDALAAVTRVVDERDNK